MPRTIVSNILTVPRFWGPISTVIFLVLYHSGSVSLGYTPVIGWLWMFLIWASFVAGFRASFLCATFISAYAWYIDGADYTLLVQRVVISFGMAITLGYLHSKLRQTWEIARANQASTLAMAELDSNLETMKKVHKHGQDLILGWQVLQDKARFEIVKTIVYKLADVISVTDGWHQLYKERKIVSDD